MFWTSRDGGSSWTSSLVSAAKSTGYAVAGDPANPAVVYAGGVQSSDQAALFKSADSGAKWTALGQGIVSGVVRKIAVHPQAPLRVFVGTADGLFLSADAGQTWDKVMPGEVREVLFDPEVAADVYAAGAAGIRRSRDFGATWEAFGTDLEFTDISSLAVDWSQRIFYAGAAAGGLYRKNFLGAGYLYPPLELRGERQEVRSVLQRELLIRLSWKTDARATSLAKYRVYLLTGDKKTLLAEVGRDTREYWHRKVPAGSVFTYIVISVDSSGREGGSAYISLSSGA